VASADFIIQKCAGAWWFFIAQEIGTDVRVEVVGIAQTTLPSRSSQENYRLALPPFGD
jgi:hypothetical protein